MTETVACILSANMQQGNQSFQISWFSLFQEYQFYVRSISLLPDISLRPD